jgi:hypothetical protein
MMVVYSSSTDCLMMTDRLFPGHSTSSRWNLEGDQANTQQTYIWWDFTFLFSYK